MNEFGSDLPPISAEGASSKEKKRKRRKRSREALGGLAANETLEIWSRDREASKKEKKRTPPIFEALQVEKPKDKDENKQKDVWTAGESVSTRDAEKNEKTTASAEKSVENKTDKDHHSKLEKAEDETAEDREEIAEASRLTPEEIHHSINEYVQVRRMELAAEQVAAKESKTDGKDSEVAALAANAEMLDDLHHKLETDPLAGNEAVAAAYDETINKLALENEAAESGEQEGAGEGTEPEQPDLEVPASTEHTAATPSGRDLESAAPPGDVPPVPPGAPPTLPPSQPPRPPYGFGVPLPPESPRVPAFAVAAPSAAAAGAAEEMISYHESLHNERRAQTRGLLVGALLGYLYGRHRGRVKTEKKLLPVQEQLKKNVNELHDTIALKERKIRALAIERNEAIKRAAAMPAVEQLAPSFAEESAVVAAEIAQQAIHARERHVEPASANREVAEPIISLPQAVEVTREFPETPALNEAIEALAVMPVAAALAPEAITEARSTSTSLPERTVAETRFSQIDSLSEPELLEVASQIYIGRDNLKDIYESKRITEPGLRHILNEYVRGGNIKRVLKQELMNKELTYERDPRMRKRLAATLSATGTVAGAASGSVAKLSYKAKPHIARHSQKVTAGSKKVGAKMLETTKELQKQDDEMRKFIVRTWLGVTLFLFLIVIILLFR